MTTRERVAGALQRAGALQMMMQLKRFAPVPTLTIVTYHHIFEHHHDYPYDPDVADAGPAQFRRQLETLLRHGTPIGIDELLAAMQGAPLPKNPMMVTFDDGYRSCHDVALPILLSLGVRATFFVPTMFLTDRRLYWWERIALLLHHTKVETATLTYPHRLPIDLRQPSTRHQLTDFIKDTPGLDVDRFLDELTLVLRVDWDRTIETRCADELIMTWDEVRAMARAGMDVESHTRSHRVLQTLDDAGLRDELAGSRKDLEAQLGRPVRAVAYPVGRRIARVARIRRAIAEAGYQIGLSNEGGVNHLWPGALRRMFRLDPFDIQRLSTERTMSDALFIGQVAIPPLAYPFRPHQR